TLTGIRPFQGGSIVTVGAAVLKGRYRPVTEIRPTPPPASAAWSAKPLSFAPAGRFSAAPRRSVASPPEPPSAEPARLSVRPPDLPQPPALRASDAALATTLPAPVTERDRPDQGALAPGATAEHAPLVRRPDDRVAIRSPGRRRALLFAAVLTLAG